MSAIRYIIEVIVCSGLFLVAYRWLLAKKVSFGLCRAFIIASMLLAVAIPAMNVPLFPEKTLSRHVILTEFDFFEDGLVGNEEVRPAGEAQVSSKTAAETVPENNLIYIKAAVGAVAKLIYVLVALASLGLTIFNIIKIQRLRGRSKLTHTEDYTLAEHEEVKTPFSFLLTIFMGFNYLPEERKQILIHEASHVRHRHSFERLTLSILRSVFWFNPFFWMAEKDLEEVQEWEADKDVLSEGYELKTYRTTIFKQLFGYNPDISCGLNHSLTKQRFIMMTQSRRGKGASIRLAATLPLIAAAFFAFGCGTKEANASNGVSTNLTNGTEQTHLRMCPPCDATVSNSFAAGKAGRSHSGIDYVLNEGDPVYAAAYGEVSSITRDDSNGLMLVLKHADGIETRYAHLSKVQIVSHLRIEGSAMKSEDVYNFVTDSDHSNQKISGKVNRGQLIGYAGSTGRATGSHLHFEVRKDGKPVDPAPMFTSDKPVTAPFPIYIVEGTNKPGEEYFAICNGKLCMINEEIGEAVSRYFAEIDDPLYANIQLEADKDVPEEIIAKVSEQLRKVQALKVSKSITESEPGKIVVLKDETTTVTRSANGAFIEVIYDPDGSRIYIDGVRHSIDEVAEVIGAKRESSDNPYDFTVQIKASSDTPMGIINDIKLQLRKCKALKVRYEGPEISVARYLPPAPDSDMYTSAEEALRAVDRRNIIVMRVNAAGEMFLGDTYVKGSLHDEKLYRKEIARLKELISNPEDKADCPDHDMKEFQMPDGSSRQIKVSNGIITFRKDRATRYEDYAKAMNLITTAYMELREELSEEVFGRSLAGLSDAEMRVVYQAVPMIVSEIDKFLS